MKYDSTLMDVTDQIATALGLLRLDIRDIQEGKKKDVDSAYLEKYFIKALQIIDKETSEFVGYLTKARQHLFPALNLLQLHLRTGDKINVPDLEKRLDAALQEAREGLKTDPAHQRLMDELVRIAHI